MEAESSSTCSQEPVYRVQRLYLIFYNNHTVFQLQQIHGQMFIYSLNSDPISGQV
jgi:hypothetical protein